MACAVSFLALNGIFLVRILPIATSKETGDTFVLPQRNVEELPANRCHYLEKQILNLFSKRATQPLSTRTAQLNIEAGINRFAIARAQWAMLSSNMLLLNQILLVDVTVNTHVDYNKASEEYGAHLLTHWIAPQKSQR